jgi:glutathione synthase/RimK-type ligase-like ATP-grasp enzyme
VTRSGVPRIALVTATAARDLDDDLAPLSTALAETGSDCSIVAWDDANADWAAFDLVLLRSPWDYTQRLPEFLDWLQRAAAQTMLLNPYEVVRWNTDKHYLSDLAAASVAIVPSAFVEPGESAAAALNAFLAAHAQARELVVKPAIGAGSRDARRHARTDRAAALAHIDQLLYQGRSVLLQPYLDRVDEQGETALIFFDGVFSHAIRKGPLLRAGEDATRALFATEHIVARTPDAAELALAVRTLGAVPFAGPLLYARVDLIRAGDGAPCVLELELAEPSLFFATATGSAARFAQAIRRRSSKAAAA